MAIDLSLKEPYLSILEKGSLATCYKTLPGDTNLIIYHSNEPKRFWKFFDNKIEDCRLYSGANISYAISYALMFWLSPLRLWIPRIRWSGQYCQGSAAQRVSIALPESRTFQRWKKFALLQHVLDHTDASWIILTTPSYYLNFGKITETIETLESQNELNDITYAGVRQSSADCDFVSGGWTLLNRSAAKQLLKSRWRAPVHVYDDIAFGVLFKKLGVPITEIRDSDFLNNTKMRDEELRCYPFIRLANSLPDGTRNDVNLFHQIHAKKL